MRVLCEGLKSIRVSALICSLALTSAFAQEDQIKTQICTTAPTPSCLVEMAVSLSEKLPISVARAQVSIEIAYAQHAMGNAEAAHDILTHASSLSFSFDDPEDKAAVLLSVAEAQAGTGASNQARKSVQQALAFEHEMPTALGRSNLIGTAAKIYARVGDFDMALGLVNGHPESESGLASIKARTFHDIGPLQAKAGFIDAGLETVRRATMGLQYYRASALTDIAKVSFDMGDDDQANALLAEAQQIAVSLDDGYFVAGALRHVGEAAFHGGLIDRARDAYEAAVEGTRSQPMGQARARALSRAATAMAESGFNEQALGVLAEAVDVAKAEENEAMRQYARYEIAGAFAFAGAIQLAVDIAIALPDTAFSSAHSLRGVTVRDVAWGEAKYVDPVNAVARALKINSTREKVMALSRIARVLVDPEMKSLSRYL